MLKKLLGCFEQQLKHIYRINLVLDKDAKDKEKLWKRSFTKMQQLLIYLYQQVPVAAKAG